MFSEPPQVLIFAVKVQVHGLPEHADLILCVLYLRPLWHWNQIHCYLLLLLLLKEHWMRLLVWQLLLLLP